MPLGAGVGAASKQTSTMPDVAVGWLHSLLGTLGGGKLGREIIYLGAAGSGTPIWDVLAPEGEREEAAEHIYSPRLINFFSIRQAVPVGFAQSGFCSWARWAPFFMGKKSYYRIQYIYIYLTLFQ